MSQDISSFASRSRKWLYCNPSRNSPVFPTVDYTVIPHDCPQSFLKKLLQYLSWLSLVLPRIYTIILFQQKFILSFSVSISSPCNICLYFSWLFPDLKTIGCSIILRDSSSSSQKFLYSHPSSCVALPNSSNNLYVKTGHDRLFLHFAQ